MFDSVFLDVVFTHDDKFLLLSTLDYQSALKIQFWSQLILYSTLEKKKNNNRNTIYTKKEKYDTHFSSYKQTELEKTEKYTTNKLWRSLWVLNRTINTNIPIEWRKEQKIMHNSNRIQNSFLFYVIEILKRIVYLNGY